MSPKVAPTAFVIDSAWVIGDVEVGPETSLWFYSVIRETKMPSESAPDATSRTPAFSMWANSTPPSLRMRSPSPTGLLFTEERLENGLWWVSGRSF